MVDTHASRWNLACRLVLNEVGQCKPCRSFFESIALANYQIGCVVACFTAFERLRWRKDNLEFPSAEVDGVTDEYFIGSHY